MKAPGNKNWLWFVWPLLLIGLLLLLRPLVSGGKDAVGKRLYTTHCAGCHGEQGEGLKRLVPPLAGADYLTNNPEEIPCIILNGMEGELVVNGITYTQPMGGVKLSPANIQQIVNYIQTHWGNEGKEIDFREVNRLIKDCD